MEFSHLQKNKRARLRRVERLLQGKWLEPNNIVTLLENVLEPQDRVCIEGDNQKQAVFLAQALCQIDPQKINCLHIVQSTLSLPEHITVFERGIANRIDFSFAESQGARLALLAQQGKVTIGGIHTYLELFSRYFLDLTPRVSLLVAEKADRAGNLYTGPNTEETPAIAEATAFKNGIVIVQVNEIVDKLPRVDIPGDWVDILVQSPIPARLSPLFTRDPAKIHELKILMAMLVVKGIYAKYGVNRLNHGIGYNTCAIELILPTYADSLGLKGKICEYMMINPVPTLIPAIESGFVKRVTSPGGEVGMDRYIQARSDIFFTGSDDSLRSNRCYAQMAGLYAVDLFAGATLQIDIEGNSSTATTDRITGFGGAPNIACNVTARRHVSPTWLMAGKEAQTSSQTMLRGKKLVVQMVETFQGPGAPTFVEKLDACELQKRMNMELPPIMIYGDDVTHIVTEEGIANLLLCRTPTEREQAIRGVAGYTTVGMARDKNAVAQLRERGAIVYPEDIGIRFQDATRELLSAKTMRDLVICSHGLYEPPTKFRDW